MRLLLMVAAIAALGACNRGGASANNSASSENKAATANSATPAAANSANAAAPSANLAGNQSAAAAGSLPPDFPHDDVTANGADCYVFLSLSMQADGQTSGYDNVAMSQSRDQWHDALRQHLSEDETAQLTASNVNPLMGTPPAQRDAASKWCVLNAPDPA